MSGLGSFVGSQQGSLRYLIEIDDSKAQDQLNQFKNSLGIFNTGVANSSKTLGTMAQQFQALGVNVGTAGTSMNTAGTNMGNLNGVMTTMQTGLGQTNTQAQTLSQTLGATQGPLRQFGTGMTTADQGTLALSKDMGALANNFAPVQGGLSRTNTLMGNMREQTGTLGSRMSGLKTKFADIGIGITATMTSAINLARGWRDLEDSQIAVDKAMSKGSTLTEAITKAQEKHNAVVKEFGPNSKEAAQSQLDLNQAMEKGRIQTEVIAEAQERHNDAQVNFWMNAIPTTIGSIATVTHLATAFGGKISTLTKFLNAMKGAAILAAPAIAGLGAALAVAAAGILASATLSKWLKDTNQSLQDLSDQGGKALDDLINKIPALGPAWAEAEKGFSKWLVDTFPQLFTEQDKAFIKNRQLAKSNDDVAKSTANVAEKQKIYDEALKNYNAKVATRQVGDEKAAKAALDKAKADLDAAKATEASAKATDTGTASIEKMSTTVGPLAMKIVPTLSTETTKLGSSISGMTDKAIKPGTKAFTDMVVAKIVARNKARDLRESWDDLWQSSVNLGKTIKENDGTVKKWNATSQEWEDVTDRTADITKELNSVLQATSGHMADMERAMGPGSFMDDKNAGRFLESWSETFGDMPKLANENMEKVNKIFKEYKAKFEQADLAKSVFDIQGDPKKMLDKLFDRLPNKLEKKIKTDLKFEQSQEDMKETFRGLMESVLEAGENQKFTWDPTLEITEQDAQDLGESMLETIEKAFPKGNVTGPWADIKKQIEEAMEKGGEDGKQALLDIFNSEEFQNMIAQNPIPMYIDPVKQAQVNAAFAGLAPVDVAIRPSVDIDPDELGKNVQDVLGITAAKNRDKNTGGSGIDWLQLQANMFPDSDKRGDRYTPGITNRKSQQWAELPWKFMFPEEGYGAYRGPGDDIYREGSRPGEIIGIGAGGMGSGSSLSPQDYFGKVPMMVDANGTLVLLSPKDILAMQSKYASRGGNLMKGGTDFRLLQQSLGGGGPQQGRRGITDPYTGQFIGSYGGTGLKTSEIVRQQRANVAGAGTFGGLIQEAASASKGVQTEMSSMWTAVTQILNNIAVVGTQAFNKLTQNAAGVINNLVSHWGAQATAMVAITQNISVTGTTSFNELTQNAAGVINMLAGHWTTQAANMIATSESISVANNKIFNQLTQNAAGNFNALVEHWSGRAEDMNKITKGVSVSSNKTFKQMTQNAAGNMNDLAKHWSKICNSFINNAEAAAKGVNSELSKIKNITRTVTIRENKITAQTGYHGILSEDTVIFAHRGEKVDISPFGGNPKHAPFRMEPEHLGGGQPGNIQIFLDNILMDRHIVRMFNMEVGKHQRRF